MSAKARASTILIVDDVPDQIATLREFLENAGFTVIGATSRQDALDALDEHFVDLLVVDERLGRASGTKLLESCRTKFPGLGGIVITGHADLECAVAAMRAGALDFLEKPTNKEKLLDAVYRALNESQLVREARYHRWRASRHVPFSEVIGDDESLRKVLNVVRQAAPTNAPILIQGETGTGKELLAHAIHACSPRRDGPFVAVNAGAIPATLMESTLFGSKKGAFTDSRADQIGLFQAASGGTIFLDEIGETTPEVQIRLLRVLQEKVITRVGDVEPISVDTRVVAATNRDLRADAAARHFRQDLYFRLAVLPVTLPALRERLADIEPLARHLLERIASEGKRSIKGFAPGCIDKLRAYRWPGNIRELANVVERAVILTDDGDVIRPDLLILDSPVAPEMEALLDVGFREAERRFEQLYFARLLERANGNKTKAAELADIDRSVLHKHLAKISR